MLLDSDLLFLLGFLLFFLRDTEEEDDDDDNRDTDSVCV